MRALGVGVLLSRSRVRDWEEEKKNGRQKHFFFLCCIQGDSQITMDDTFHHHPNVGF